MSRGPDPFANKRYYDESDMDHGYERRDTLHSDTSAPAERYYDKHYDSYGLCPSLL